MWAVTRALVGTHGRGVDRHGPWRALMGGCGQTRGLAGAHGRSGQTRGLVGTQQ